MFSSGERFPVLIDDQGRPDFASTLFVTIKFRNGSRAPNTQAHVLEAIERFYRWSEKNQLDVLNRLARRDWLRDHEIEGLVSFLRRRQSPTGRSSKVREIRPQRPSQVSPTTVWYRIAYIETFLKWVSEYKLTAGGGHLDLADKKQIDLMLSRLRQRRPRTGQRSGLNQKRGLSEVAQEELMELVSPDNPRNPFHRRVRLRNQLIIRLLLATGIRAGELLSIRVGDVNFAKNHLLIARRHDQKDDPRRVQPVVKTLDRLLPLQQELAESIHDYVAGQRRTVAAKNYSYLFVVHKAGPYKGRPLTRSAINRIFKDLRGCGGEELANLSPHTLRHTMNENLSKAFDEQEISVAKEEQIRSNLNGWKEGSGTASTYLRRHTEKEAMRASLEMQRNIFGMGDGKK